MNRARVLLAASVLAALVAVPTLGRDAALPRAAADSVVALPSWNDVPSRKAILDFVLRVTTPGPEFVPEPERIAVFDNDGTLWAEQPMYFQFAFALDRVKATADKHPEWKGREPFRSILLGDLNAALGGGEKAVLEVVRATHAGMTTDEFQALVRDWIGTAVHPTLKRRYVDCVYQPMVELLAFLRAKGFKTYIVSGGGVEFMRAWVERVYGIPPEQVVGSRTRVKYEERETGPVLVRLPEVDFIDDKAGKPDGIHQMIGRRPIAAFGNSDGDYEMLRWTTSGKGPHLGLLVHHTDAEREWAYDKESQVGRLQKALDEAPQRGWVVVDMKKDWTHVFPPNADPGR